MIKKDSERLYDLSDWALFFSVLDEKSIASAAIKHNMDRSQLSRMISMLEQSLGKPLLIRQGRSIMPTGTALEARRRIEPAIQEIVRAIDHLHRDDDQLAGTIRLGGMPGFLQAQVVPMLVEFQQLYPSIAFDVIAREDRSTFMKGQVDVMLYYGPVHDKNLVEHWVSRSAFVPCASPKYLKKIAKSLNCPADLEDCAGLIFLSSLRPHSEILEKGSQIEKIRFKSEIRFNSILSAKSACVQAGGILLDIPLHHAYGEILDGSLVPVLQGWHVPNLDNYIASTREAAKVRRIQLFIDWYTKRRREIEQEQKIAIREKFDLIV